MTYEIKAIIKDGKRRTEEFLNFDIDNTDINKKYITDIVKSETIYNRNVKNIHELEINFIKTMGQDENVGLHTEEDIHNIRILTPKFPLTKPEQETYNMFLCWEFFSQIHRDTGKSFLTRGLIEQGHEILMKNLIKNPGKMSENKRQTQCPILNKNIYYPDPDFITEQFDTFIDYTNQIYSYLENKILKCGFNEKVIKLAIKFHAWFFISFIRLHPFSDGNGRLARILYAYLQLSISPVPIGIYNRFSKTSKTDYMKVISEVQLQHETHMCNQHWCFISKPHALSNLILNCLRFTWVDIVAT